MNTTTAKRPAQKSYGAPDASAKLWDIHARAPGDTGLGEQASPSTFYGTQAAVTEYCAELSAHSREAGRGPVRDFLHTAG